MQGFFALPKQLANLNRLAHLLCTIVLAGSFILPDLCEARPKRKRKFRKAIQVRTLGDFDTQSGAYSFHFGEQLDSILQASVDFELYDPVVIRDLEELKEDAQPYWDPFDIDPIKARHAVQKAFTIQSARTVLPIIKKSELRSSYRSIERGYRYLSDKFKYSVKNDGDGYYFANKSKRHGETLLELNMKMNLSSGLDPLLHFGDSFRLRYDWVKGETLFEYGFDF